MSPNIGNPGISKYGNYTGIKDGGSPNSGETGWLYWGRLLWIFIFRHT